MRLLRRMVRSLSWGLLISFLIYICGVNFSDDSIASQVFFTLLAPGIYGGFYVNSNGNHELLRFLLIPTLNVVTYSLLLTLLARLTRSLQVSIAKRTKRTIVTLAILVIAVGIVRMTPLVVREVLHSLAACNDQIVSTDNVAGTTFLCNRAFCDGEAIEIFVRKEGWEWFPSAECDTRERICLYWIPAPNGDESPPVISSDGKKIFIEIPELWSPRDFRYEWKGIPIQYNFRKRVYTSLD